MDVKARLAKIVGSRNVSDARRELELFATDHSLIPPRMPNYVVRPGNTDDVQKVIQLANEISMPVVPVSSGIHFYGASLPLQGGIMLDLRRMDRILEVDPRNRKVRIEPGVTWGQLQTELEKHQLMALIPFLPHPLKSVLTSHLEREPILIPKYEYSDPMLTMEAVLPHGGIMRTGSACVPGAPTGSTAEGVQPEGPGIDFWRLFQGAQGTMGVITWANLKVEYLPKVTKMFFLPFDHISDAIEPLYRIQRRMIGLECFLLNSFNLAAILADELSEDIEDLMTTLPTWTLILALSGGRKYPEMKIEYEEEALREIGAEYSLSQILPALPGLPRAEKKLLDMLRRPWPQEKTYWKFAYQGACQDIFFHTTLEQVPDFVEILAELLSYHNLDDFGFYIQPLEYGRACHFECNVYYDKLNPEDVEIVQEFYTEAAQVLLDQGAFFTRPYGILADIVYARSTAYTATLKKLKKLFDPNNILSPGRLCFP